MLKPASVRDDRSRAGGVAASTAPPTSWLRRTSASAAGTLLETKYSCSSSSLHSFTAESIHHRKVQLPRIEQLNKCRLAGGSRSALASVDLPTPPRPTSISLILLRGRPPRAKSWQ